MKIEWCYVIMETTTHGSVMGQNKDFQMGDEWRASKHNHSWATDDGQIHSLSK